jgi:hypothetical protein
VDEAGFGSLLPRALLEIKFSRRNTSSSIDAGEAETGLASEEWSFAQDARRRALIYSEWVEVLIDQTDSMKMM